MWPKEKSLLKLSQFSPKKKPWAEYSIHESARREEKEEQEEEKGEEVEEEKEEEEEGGGNRSRCKLEEVEGGDWKSCLKSDGNFRKSIWEISFDLSKEGEISCPP